MIIRNFVVLAAVLAAFASQAATLKVGELGLVPQPREIKATGGSVSRDALRGVVAAPGAEVPILGALLDALPRSAAKGQPTVTFVIDSLSTPQKSEGYTLTLNRNGARIASRSQAGLFYGAATLEQMLQRAADTRSDLPALTVTDWPELDFRAVHFDTKHHLDRLDYYYKVIDRLASWKVNGIIWELEDKLQFPSHPECSAPNAITTQQMQALSRYAKERNVEISPLVQGLGHASFILKNHWELRENPASDWEFCPSNPATYELQFDLYRDALNALPDGKYLHIGGDEITAIGIDERCKATGKTPFQLQMEWLGKVTDYAHQHGRTPIFWDDMPLKYGDVWWVIHRGLTDEEVEKNFHTEGLDEAIDMFPKDCIYMRWHYDDPTILAHRKVLDWYGQKGLKVMAATAASDGGSPFMPRFGSKTGHISKFCQLSADKGFEGILATAWDDGSPHWETIMRGFAALGEYAWNPNGAEIPDFKEAFAADYFGLDNGETAFIETLEDAAGFFDGALVKEGRRNPAWGATQFTLIDLPDAGNPGKWSRQYKGRLDSARQQVERCEGLRNDILTARNRARRNRYTLDVYEQNRRLFLFPAQALLALENFDQTGSTEQLQGLQRQFDTMRSDLEDVYSQTRFMAQPDGYNMDLNHHNHLAAFSADDSWLFLYEIPFLRSIESLISPSQK